MRLNKCGVLEKTQCKDRNSQSLAKKKIGNNAVQQDYSSVSFSKLYGKSMVGSMSI